MKQVSNDYKNQIKEMGREIDSIITYYNHYKMITENGHYILTENGVKIKTEQINSSSYVEIGAEDTYSSKVITHGSLLKTMMREFDFEVRQEMNIGSIVNYKFGVKVNGTYEYVDLGNFIVQEKEYNEDTSTYSYKAYDMMLKSMIPYKDTTTYPAPLIRLLKDILGYCDIPTNLYGTPGYDFPNQDRICDSNPFEGMDITCRDALDMITEVTGCSSFIKNDKFVISGPTDSKSDNLFNISAIEEGKYIDTAGNLVNTSNSNTSDYIPVKKNEVFTISWDYEPPLNSTARREVVLYDGEKIFDITITLISMNDKTITFSVPRSGYIRFDYDKKCYDIQLERGPNASHYVPYGQLIFNADSFKDTNVKFNKLYGPINSILFSRNEDLDVIEIKDEASIEQYGVTQIKIKDNPLLEGNDRGDYFEEMFGVLDGLTYYVNELSSIGITYLEYMDLFKVQIENNEYQCLLLNDEINVEQGLEENIFSEEIEETEQEYKTSVLSDKEQKWANINIKKDVAEISLEVGEKVGKGEVISSINLSPESATIQASKINLQGYVTVTDLSTGGRTTINGSNITTGTISANRVSGGTLEGSNIKCGNNFYVNTSGKVTASDMDITGGSVVLTRNATGQDTPLTIRQYYEGDTLEAKIGVGVIRFLTNGVQRASFSAGTTAGRLFLANSSGTTTISGYGSNGALTCVSLTQTSKEEEKKNFKKLENALDIVKDVDIYEYNMKFEKDEDKKHIGFVIGDKYNYRKEITSQDNDGVDTYSMISVLWKAVQEQQEQIEELKKKVK